MNNETGTQVSRPKPIHRKSPTFNFKEFSLAFAKGSIDLFMGKWGDVAEDGLDAIDALGLKSTPQEIAWLLVSRAIMQAMATLAEEAVGTSSNHNNYLDELKSTVNDTLEESALTVDEDFFSHPENAEFIEILQPSFALWLESVRVTEAEAKTISQRLPIYFASALHEEWGRRPSLYAPLEDDLYTPFSQSHDRGRSWLRYSSSLQKQVEEPVFSEAFSLKQIFVNLRAYYECVIEKETADELLDLQLRQVKKIVIDLKEELEIWLEQADKDDAIRLISGGPGSGKSSFAKMFAAQQARRGRIPVLFIPLYLFNPSGDLIESIEQFVQIEGYLRHNPLDPKYKGDRLLIIFDGLDELSMQGKIAEQTALDFVREVQRKVLQFNQRRSSVQVLISGRDLAIQANMTAFRKDGQILYILPYFLSTDEQMKYVDDQGLLEKDQRQVWWKRYGEASGKGYKALPDDLAQDNLLEITSQPLLNYLVALSYNRGKLNFTEETNLNTIYDDLLKAVYERGWTGNPHPSLQDIKEERFVRILEEIALASWHGDGRTTTVKEIRERCEQNGLKKFLERFQASMQQDTRASSITQLLTAFYFRQSGGYRESEETFEFTHKSFGEYLTARRIFRELKKMHKKLQAQDDDPDNSWDERTALMHWIMLSGPSALSHELFNFVKNEIRLHYMRKPEDVLAWQTTLCDLIGFVLRRGLPTEKLTPRPDFQEERRQVRNAEEALLAILNICATINDIVSEIEWPMPLSFASWLLTLRSARPGDKSELTLNCLSYLNFDDCILHGIDLSGANLDRVSLRAVDLDSVNLSYTDITNANLEDAQIVNTDLSHANFTEANLKNAQIANVILSHANFAEANLKNAQIANTDLSHANFTEANLENAQIGNVILSHSHFIETDIECVQIGNVILSHSNFEDMDFKNVQFKNVIFTHATLTNVNFDEVIFHNVIHQLSQLQDVESAGENREETIYVDQDDSKSSG